MFRSISILIAFTAVLCLGCVLPCLAAAAAPDQAAVDKAFDALKTFQWGQERKTLIPIEEAVMASPKDAAAQKALEARLAAVLKTAATAYSLEWDRLTAISASPSRFASRRAPPESLTRGLPVG